MAKVKFSRGPQNNYDNLQIKNKDTLYIRTDSGRMYLGGKLVSDPDAVKSVQVGTTTTGAAGTNASVTNSGTTQAPVLNFTIPRGADGRDGQDAVSPFKGWFDSSSDLPANPSVGDYAYVYDASPSTAVSIYRCATTGTWADSGLDVDASNVQTFRTGEQVANTGIVDDYRDGLSTDVLSAKKGMEMGQMLRGVTLTETKASLTQLNYQVNGSTGALGTNADYKHVKINCAGYKKVRFIAQTISPTSTMGYAFWGDADNVVAHSSFPTRTGSSNETIELIVDVPPDAKYFLTTSGGNSYLRNFYCYLEKGDTVVEMIPSVVDNDTDGGSGKAWSAERGKAIRSDMVAMQNEVNGYDEDDPSEQTLTSGAYYNTSGTDIASTPTAMTAARYAKIAVNQGDVFRITGVRNGSTKYRLYATTDSDGLILRKSSTGDGTTRYTYELTIESGESWMYVNIIDYDSSTDGVWQLGVETKHVEGVSDDLYMVEQNLRGTTFTQSMVTGNSLHVADGYKLDDGEITAETGCAIAMVAVSGHERVRVCNIRTTSTSPRKDYGFAFYSSKDTLDGTTLISFQHVDNDYESGMSYYKEYLFDVPEGAVTFVVNCKDSSYTNLANRFYCYLEDGKTVLETVNETIAIETSDFVQYGKFCNVDTSASTISYGNATSGFHIGRIKTNGLFDSDDHYRYILIPIRAGQFVKVKRNGSQPSYLAFLTSDDLVNGQVSPYVAGTGLITVSKKNTDFIYEAPNGVVYLYAYVWANTGGTVYYPDYLGVSRYEDDVPNIVDINDEVETRRILYQMSSQTRDEVTAGYKPFVLVHYSDLHGDKEGQERIVQFADYFSEYIDDVIQTGDLVSDKFSHPIYMSVDDNSRKILSVIGNHDTKVSGSDEHGKQGLPVYNKFIAPFVQYWGVTQPSDASTVGKCYYYKDYAAKKIRLIVLDTWYDAADGDTYNTDQLAWFVTTLSDAQTLGYTVVVAAHFKPRYSVMCETVFSNPGSTVDNANTSWRTDEYIAALCQFIAGGGKCACWISGHAHYDTVSMHTEEVNGTTVHMLSVCVANAGRTIFSSSQSWRQNSRINVDPKDYKTFDLFNVMAVDTKYEVVTLLRIGSNYDKYGRYIRTSCINYKTGVVYSGHSLFTTVPDSSDVNPSQDDDS